MEEGNGMPSGILFGSNFELMFETTVRCRLCPVMQTLPSLQPTATCFFFVDVLVQPYLCSNISHIYGTTSQWYLLQQSEEVCKSTDLWLLSRGRS